MDDQADDSHSPTESEISYAMRSSSESISSSNLAEPSFSEDLDSSPGPPNTPTHSGSDYGGDDYNPDSRHFVPMSQGPGPTASEQLARENRRDLARQQLRNMLFDPSFQAGAFQSAPFPPVQDPQTDGRFFFPPPIPTSPGLATPPKIDRFPLPPPISMSPGQAPPLQSSEGFAFPPSIPISPAQAPPRKSRRFIFPPPRHILLPPPSQTLPSQVPSGSSRYLYPNTFSCDFPAAKDQENGSSGWESWSGYRNAGERDLGQTSVMSSSPSDQTLPDRVLSGPFHFENPMSGQTPVTDSPNLNRFLAEQTSSGSFHLERSVSAQRSGVDDGSTCHIPELPRPGSTPRPATTTAASNAETFLQRFRNAKIDERKAPTQPNKMLSTTSSATTAREEHTQFDQMANDDEEWDDCSISISYEEEADRMMSYGRVIGPDVPLDSNMFAQC